MLSVRALQDISTVVSLFQTFGGKELVHIHAALSPHYQHFSGITFMFVETGGESHRGRRKRRLRRVPLAIGGR